MNPIDQPLKWNAIMDSDDDRKNPINSIFNPMKLKPFSKQQITCLLECVNDFVESDKSIDDVLKLLNGLGHISNKLNLTHGKNGGSLAHLRDVLESCLIMESEGAMILSIESTGNNGKINCPDVDIIIEFSDIVYALDYTNHKVRASEQKKKKFLGVNVLPDVGSFLQTKYMILRSSFLETHGSKVISIESKDIPDFDLQFPEPEGDDMKTLDKIDRWAMFFQSLTKGQIENLMRIAARNLSKLDYKDTIKDLPTCASIYDRNNCVKSLKENGEKSALIFNNFKSKCKSKEAYSLKHSNIYEKDNLKSLTYVPIMRSLVSTGCKEESLDSRIKLIMDSKSFSYFIWVASLCKDNEWHPTSVEIKTVPNLTDNHMIGSFSLQKVKSDLGESRSFRVNMDNTKFNELIYGSGETSFSRSQRDFRDSLKLNQSCDYVDLEKQWKQSEQWLSSKSSERSDARIISRLIDMLPKDTKLTNLTHSIIKKIFLEMSDTKLLKLASCIAKVSETILSTYHKIKKIKRVSNTTIISMEPIKGMAALVILNNTTINTDCSFSIHGLLISTDKIGTIISQHHRNQTKWSNSSPSSRDWNISVLAKIVSYLSMQIGQEMTFLPDKKIRTIIKEKMFATVLCLTNDSKFVQFAQDVRYMVINITGISTGTTNLYDKLIWYCPSSSVTKLYCLRTLKMTTMFQLIKSNGDQNHCYETVASSTTVEGKNMSTTRTILMMAEPHETNYCHSSMELYNGFYLSKFQVLNRCNDLVSEAAVFNKQWKILSDQKSLVSELSPTYFNVIEEPSDYVRLKVLVENHVMKTKCKGHLKSCLLTILLSASYSIVSIGNHSDTSTIESIINSNYSVDDFHLRQNMSELMNTRGSVSLNGPSGIIGPKEMTVDNKTNVKIKKISQNSVCYIEAMKMKHRVYTKTLPNYTRNLSVDGTFLELDDIKTKDMCASLIRKPDFIWPILLKCYFNKVPFVARMTKKDQVGPREIAVMNLPLRMECYIHEQEARHIKHVENSLGDYVNLIENPRKDKIIEKNFNKYNRSSMPGKVHDNADQSGFGPNQDQFTLYTSTRMRMIDTFRIKLLKHGIFNNLQKVFKFPDKLHRYHLKELSKGKSFINPVSAIDIAMNRMTQNSDFCNREKGFFYVRYGMFQGTKGVASTVTASDSIRFSDYLKQLCVGLRALHVVSECTSDDSHRGYTYDLSLQDEFSLIEFKGNRQLFNFLTMTTQVSDSLHGSKRNMEKSTMNRYKGEMNSIFYDSDGKVIPNIKSRLSYIAFSGSSDMYSSALNCLDQSVEYLCKHQSVIGATWVMICNLYLHIKKFMLEELLFTNPDAMFTCPLELGGIPKIDPVAAVMTSTLGVVTENYGGLETFLALTQDDILGISLTASVNPEVSKAKSVSPVPSLSRSRLFRMNQRSKMKARLTREFLEHLEPDDFLGQTSWGGNKNLRTLIANMRRDESTGFQDRPSILYEECRRPLDLACFNVQSKFYRDLFKSNRVSKRDLFSMISRWSNFRMTATDDQVIIQENKKYHDHGSTDIKVFETISTISFNVFSESVPSLSGLIESYKLNAKSIIPMRIIPTDQITKSHHVVNSFISSQKHDTVLNAFTNEQRPISLGGFVDVHPFHYVMAYTILKHRLKKLTKTVHTIQLSQTPSKSSVLESIYFTCYTESGRLIISKGTQDYVGENQILSRKSLGRLNQKWFEPDLLKQRSQEDCELHNIEKGNNKLIDITTVINCHLSGHSGHYGSLKLTSDILLLTESKAREMQNKNKNEIFVFYPSNRSAHWCGVKRNSGKYRFEAKSISSHTGSTTVISMPYQTKGSPIAGTWSGVDQYPSTTDYIKRLDFSSAFRIKISLKNRMGYLWMKAGDYWIYPLCQSLIKDSTVLYLQFKQSWWRESDLDTIRDSYFDSKEIYESHEQNNENQVLAEHPVEEFEEISGDIDEYGDLGDIQYTMSLSDGDDDDEEVMLGKAESDENDEDDYYDDDEVITDINLDELSVLSALTIQPSVDLMASTISSGSFQKLHFRSRYYKETGISPFDFNIIRVELPSTMKGGLNDINLRETKEQSCFSLLHEFIGQSSEDSVTAEWLLSYVMESIKKSHESSKYNLEECV